VQIQSGLNIGIGLQRWPLAIRSRTPINYNVTAAGASRAEIDAGACQSISQPELGGRTARCFVSASGWNALDQNLHFSGGAWEQ